MLYGNNNERERHILFLENLLNKVKNNQLSYEEQRELSEFYINYLYFNQNNEIDEKNIKKYISMGWYIYEFLNNNDNNDNNK